MSVSVPIRTSGNAAGYPVVRGLCPSCGWSSLFLGSNGHVTCGNLDCPNPVTMDAFEEKLAARTSVSEDLREVTALIRTREQALQAVREADLALAVWLAGRDDGWPPQDEENG